MARAIDGTWDSFLLNLSYLTLKDFQENKAGLNTLKTAVESQPTITPPNEPLTLEQLREMGGQPYWHVGLREESPPPHWNILDPFYAKHIEDYRYGENWLAYRRPKEEE